MGMFWRFGHVGTHPQFRHLANPPRGFTFLNRYGWWPRRVLGVIGCWLWLLRRGLARGVPLGEVLYFLRKRGPFMQFWVPPQARLAFVPSVPYILGQLPWVIEIEDTTTLFSPHVKNTETRDRGVKDHPVFPLVEELLADDSCRAILCHVRSTADSLGTLFDDPRVAAKAMHVPLGVSTRGVPPRPRPDPEAPCRILFTNSWHQGDEAFYVRGGLDVLAAFERLVLTHPRCTLTLRTRLPADLPTEALRVVALPQVRVLDRSLSDDEMEALRTDHDVYVLPSARLHVVSVLEAMAYGMAVVTSDGWGMEEYVDHDQTGLVVKGRGARTSWIDERGQLREDYQVMRAVDPAYVRGLTEALVRLAADPEDRYTLGRAAAATVRERFHLQGWNQGLGEALRRGL